MLRMTCKKYSTACRGIALNSISVRGEPAHRLKTLALHHRPSRRRFLSFPPLASQRAPAGGLWPSQNRKCCGSWSGAVAVLPSLPFHPEPGLTGEGEDMVPERPPLRNRVERGLIAALPRVNSTHRISTRLFPCRRPLVVDARGAGALSGMYGF